MKLYFLSLLLVFSFATPMAVTQTALAATDNGGISATCNNRNEVCVKRLPRTNANGDFVQNVLRIILGIIGAVSVLFVAIGGMRYVFSQGDPQAVSKAKSTIVFALIGLVIAIVAQGIVSLVVRAFS